jgi:hypothetical protein
VTGVVIFMKSARYTFASAVKDKRADGGLLCELMGRRRNDVDNYHKEAYPEKIRDKAQLKVIKL